MTMREKIARAIDPEAFSAFEMYSRHHPVSETHAFYARELELVWKKAEAALDAMREPTLGMSEAGETEADACGAYATSVQCEMIFRAMIDAAKTE